MQKYDKEGGMGTLISIGASLLTSILSWMDITTISMVLSRSTNRYRRNYIYDISFKKLVKNKFKMKRIRTES